MNRIESPLIRRILELPIPAADRARAIAEFERAERLVDGAADLVSGVRRRIAGHGTASSLQIRAATR